MKVLTTTSMFYALGLLLPQSHTLWPFRKRPDALDTAEQERLETLLTYSPTLRQAYLLREQLTTIFDTARSKADGLRRIRFWRQRVSKSGLRCFDGFLKLSDTWLDLIANYFIDHQPARLSRASTTSSRC